MGCELHHEALAPDKVKSVAGRVSRRTLSSSSDSCRAQLLVCSGACAPSPALTIHNMRLELQVGEMERGRERMGWWGLAFTFHPGAFPALFSGGRSQRQDNGQKDGSQPAAEWEHCWW